MQNVCIQIQIRMLINIWTQPWSVPRHARARARVCVCVCQRWSEYITNVLEYEYDYFEHA